MNSIAPKYYQEKNLEVEQWYIITDIKELVRNDFENLRDNYLANFTTPNFKDHTYAVYGNNYVYPLVVNMKQKVDYFEGTNTKYYVDVYKSQQYLDTKQGLLKFSFGEKYIHFMHPNSMDNIISAEIEYQENIQNPLYDFSSVIVKYAKTIEQEIYLFFKVLINFLSQQEPSILNIEYSVQRFNYTLKDIFVHKPNLGTYKYLLGQYLIQNSIRQGCNKQMQYYLSKTLSQHISTIQVIRNETVHGNPPLLKEVQLLREKIIGIGCESIIIELVKKKNSTF